MYWNFCINQKPKQRKAKSEKKRRREIEKKKNKTEIAAGGENLFK